MRASCPHCLRPLKTCICGLACRVETNTEVCILQHPLEVQNAKGSARLLHLCLPNSQLIVGETFSEQQLNALLTANKHNLLLYPTEDISPQTIIDGTTIDEATIQDSNTSLSTTCIKPIDKQPLRLIVIDGTWRKSRKILHLNPRLAQLPRYGLAASHCSHYHIRKAHKPGQLSTFEASQRALEQLEEEREKLQPLTACFEAFIRKQQQFLPQEAQR